MRLTFPLIILAVSFVAFIGYEVIMINDAEAARIICGSAQSFRELAKSDNPGRSEAWVEYLGEKFAAHGNPKASIVMGAAGRSVEQAERYDHLESQVRRLLEIPNWTCEEARSFLGGAWGPTAGT